MLVPSFVVTLVNCVLFYKANSFTPETLALITHMYNGSADHLCFFERQVGDFTRLLTPQGDPIAKLSSTYVLISTVVTFAVMGVCTLLTMLRLRTAFTSMAEKRKRQTQNQLTAVLATQVDGGGMRRQQALLDARPPCFI